MKKLLKIYGRFSHLILYLFKYTPRNSLFRYFVLLKVNLYFKSMGNPLCDISDSTCIRVLEVNSFTIKQGNLLKPTESKS